MYHQKDSLVKQQLFSTITDHILLHVQKSGASSAVWTEICKIHKGKSDLVQIDLRCRLSDTHCEESGDIRNHFGELLKLREALAGMGTSLLDSDFAAIIMGSLPESYRPILSSMSAGARIAKTPLSPEDLISFITEEYEHRQLTINRTTKKVTNSAFFADVQRRKGSTQAQGARKQREQVPIQCVTTATGRDTTRQIVGVPEVERKAKGQRENRVEARRLKNRRRVSLLYHKSKRI
jgi:hypothetical protein